MYVKGSVAIITGGARGLGKAFAEALLTRGGKVRLCLKSLNVMLKPHKCPHPRYIVIFHYIAVTVVKSAGLPLPTGGHDAIQTCLNDTYEQLLFACLQL